MARTYFRPRGPNPWISHQGVEYQAGDDGWVTVDDDALAAIFRDGGYVEKGAALSPSAAAAVQAAIDAGSLGGGGSLPYDTVSLSATTAGIRSAPCQVAGFTCTSSTSLNINLYANSANSGTLIWSGALTVGQVVALPGPYSSFLGLSLQIVSGSGTVAIQVR